MAPQVNRNYRAEMYRATLQATLDDPWRFMDPIRVGRVPRGEPEPQRYITVARDGVPIARIDAYAEDPGPFMDCVAWGRFILLGWDAAVHLIDPLTRKVLDVECAWYFGRFYPLDDRLLIASASELICIDPHGDVLWRRGDLGLDGIVVTSTTNGMIRGEGEWDPPGGWAPFCVSLERGTLLEGGDPRRE